VTRGWFNMACWNGLSNEQQQRLIEVGNLPINYTPEGECQNGASLCIETQDDKAPGPRFYCTPCAVDFLTSGLLKDAINLTASFAAACAKYQDDDGDVTDLKRYDEMKSDFGEDALDLVEAIAAAFT